MLIIGRSFLFYFLGIRLIKISIIESSINNVDQLNDTNQNVNCLCGTSIHNFYELLNIKTNKTIPHIGPVCIYKLAIDLTDNQKQQIGCLLQLKRFDEIKENKSRL